MIASKKTLRRFPLSDKRIALHSVTVEGLNHAFVLIPRCASYSLRVALLETIGITNESPLSHPALIEAPPGLPSLAIVRNPVNRLVSLYRGKILVGPVPRRMIALGFKRGMTLREFVTKIQKVGTQADIHMASQTSFITSREAVWLVRFEKLLAQWPRIMDKTGIGQIRPANQTPKSAPFPEISPSLQQAISNLYAPDFVLYHEA